MATSLTSLGISPANPLAAKNPAGNWWNNNWAYSGGGSGNYTKPSEVVEAATGIPAGQQNPYKGGQYIPGGFDWLPVVLVAALFLIVGLIFD